MSCKILWTCVLENTLMGYQKVSVGQHEQLVKKSGQKEHQDKFTNDLLLFTKNSTYYRWGLPIQITTYLRVSTKLKDDS